MVKTMYLLTRISGDEYEPCYENIAVSSSEESLKKEIIKDRALIKSENEEYHARYVIVTEYLKMTEKVRSSHPFKKAPVMPKYKNRGKISSKERERRYKLKDEFYVKFDKWMEAKNKHYEPFDQQIVLDLIKKHNLPDDYVVGTDYSMCRDVTEIDYSIEEIKQV